VAPGDELKTVLVLIDIQKGFAAKGWGNRNNPQAEEQAALLLAAWRLQGQPVFHVQHLSRLPDSPLHRSSPGSAIQDVVAPREGEPWITKDVNSAFIGTSLEARLRSENIGRVVLAGLTTDHCVSTTARMAANLDFQVVVVSDATATFERTGPDGRYWTADEMHSSALASLHGEFAEILPAKRAIELVKA
jgi:nicotinamidase-related amidase